MNLEINYMVCVPLLVAACWIVLLYVCKSKRIEIMIATGSIFGTFFLAEGIIYLVYPQVDESSKLYIPDEERGWTFKPGAEAAVVTPGEVHHIVKINRQGFRDQSFGSITEDAKKIAVLGDSFTSNISVGQEEVFTTLLSEKIPGATVMNFGVNGYGQTQERLLTQEVLDTYKPAGLVIVVYIRNDTTDNTIHNWLGYPRPYAELRDGTLQFKIARVESEPTTAPWLWRFAQTSQLISLVYNQGGWLIEHLKESPENGDFAPSRATPPELYLCKKELSPEIKSAFEVQQALLLDIAGIAKERSTPILFVLAPTFVQVHKKYWQQLVAEYTLDESLYDLAAPNKNLMEFAQKHELQMVDLLPALRRSAEEGKELYFPVEQHWNQLGNATVAEILEPFLKNMLHEQ